MHANKNARIANRKDTSDGGRWLVWLLLPILAILFASIFKLTNKVSSFVGLQLDLYESHINRAVDHLHSMASLRRTNVFPSILFLFGALAVAFAWAQNNEKALPARCKPKLALLTRPRRPMVTESELATIAPKS